MIQHYRTIQRQRAAGELDVSGFTLIELLIVIVVLGILAAVVVFALGGVAAQSAVSACNADAKTVEVAVAAYNAQTGQYPGAVAITNGVPTGQGVTDLTTQTTVGGVNVGPYLQSWPNNTNANYQVTLVAGTGEVDVTVNNLETPATGGYDSTSCALATT